MQSRSCFFFHDLTFLASSALFIILATLVFSPSPLSATDSRRISFVDISSNGTHEVPQALPAQWSVTVAKDGSGNFSTIAEAISHAPCANIDSDGYFRVIHIKEGVYEEHIVIPHEKKSLMLVGQGIGKTIVTGNRSQHHGWSLMDTSTFIVLADGFVAMEMTFRNTAGPENYQAVAVTNSANRSTFYKCSFEGYQDTLYVHSATQFYRECDVYGTVDFIFGNAAAVLQNCNIYVRRTSWSNMESRSMITAQSREGPDEKTGISIHGCNILAAPEQDRRANNYYYSSTFLGRPWREYSRTVYMQCYMDEIVDPSGWAAWNETEPVDKVFYGEYGNYGPGADTAGTSRVNWPGFHRLSDLQALSFTPAHFIDAASWVPTHFVPLDLALFITT